VIVCLIERPDKRDCSFPAVFRQKGGAVLGVGFKFPDAAEGNP
jgi:hypothetical protein